MSTQHATHPAGRSRIRSMIAFSVLGAFAGVLLLWTFVFAGPGQFPNLRPQAPEPSQPSQAGQEGSSSSAPAREDTEAPAPGAASAPPAAPGASPAPPAATPPPAARPPAATPPPAAPQGGSAITAAQAGAIAVARVGGTVDSIRPETSYGAAWDVDVYAPDGEYTIYISSDGRIVRVDGPFVE